MLTANLCALHPAASAGKTSRTHLTSLIPSAESIGLRELLKRKRKAAMCDSLEYSRNWRKSRTRGGLGICFRTPENRETPKS